MFWFDKKNPLTVYFDARVREKGFCKERYNFSIKPDLQGDFRKLPFKKNKFKLVVFDPPHLKRPTAEQGIITKKYGSLPVDWKPVIADGFKECFRVLAVGGVMIFKWNEKEIKLKDVLNTIGEKPLLGHTTGSRNQTIWLVFMKTQ